MNEISPEQSEAIIVAAARGQASADSPQIGELLAGLHAPGNALGTAPVLDLSSTGFAGRVARRTAVAASAAVLGLASVAAATTGAGALLGDDSPPPSVDDAIVEETDIEAAELEVDEDEGADAAEEPVARAGDEDEAVAESESDHGGGNRPEIEGVDASDGLDEDELELLCEGAENHGHYVSSVARDKSSDNEESHGERVREAAASDCGKGDKDDAEDETDNEDETEEADERDDDDAEDRDDESSDDNDGDDDRPGNGNGNGRGHSKAKGNGHGNNGNGNGNGHDRD